MTLGQHDQLVEQHNRAGTPTEQEKARADAAPLRAKLQTLRRDVTSLAAAVDQARRRASQAGVTLIAESRLAPAAVPVRAAPGQPGGVAGCLVS